MKTLTCATCAQEFTKPVSRGRYPRRCDTCSGAAAPTIVRPQHVQRLDPPVRPDGKCACGCGRLRRLTKQARVYAGAQLDADPFATSDCCKRWYGVEFAVSEEEQEASERNARGRHAAQQRLERIGSRMPGRGLPA